MIAAYGRRASWQSRAVLSKRQTMGVGRVLFSIVARDAALTSLL